jgi:hypothetical protein
VLLTLVGIGSASAVTPTTVYNATPQPLPPNVASLGFQATSTSQFGDYIHLGGTDRVLNTVTVTMSDWALYSDYATDGRYSANSATWTHPITVNVYAKALDGNGVPTTLLATKTQNVTIPWRPAANATCPGGTAWRAADTLCYNGLAFNAAFDMSSSNVVLPNDVIVGIAFSTQTYGASPLGVAGPYNSLNVGTPTGQTSTVGADDNPDNTFWDTTYPGYTAGFRSDFGWTPNGTVAIKITATAPLVGPPTNKDQCKSDGWKSFNNPAFKNQGDCVSFVATGGKNPGKG